MLTTHFRCCISPRVSGAYSLFPLFLPCIKRKRLMMLPACVIPMHGALKLAILLMLVWCCSLCLAKSGGRCMFDEIAAKAGRPRVLALRRTKAGMENVKYDRTGSVDPEWQHIRIVVFAEDMKDRSRYCTSAGQERPTFFGETATCSQEDILTAAKRDIAVTKLLPSAVQMHMDRLLVDPITEPLVFPPFDGSVCSEFKVPSSHFSEGVPDADMVMYAAAGPTPEGVAAWATGCITLDDGRAVAGVTNLGPGSISLSETSIRTAAHEIAHALGFDFEAMNDAGMVQRIPGVRGKVDVTLISSPRTLQKAREHYNCPDAPGMELEDEGGSGTALSHWERRNAKDEIMSGISSPGRYTALTMAAFEDLGYYRGAWGSEEPMGWGNNSGCELLNESCLVNGVTAHPDMFCNETVSKLVCNSERDGLGRCNVIKHENPLPPQYHYFSDPSRGAPSHLLMDYCPSIDAFSNTPCADGETKFMRGSLIGPSSMCLKAEGLRDSQGVIGDVCADVRCDGGEVSIRYLGDDAWHPCPEGSHIKPTTTFTDGVIVCPTYSEVCIKATVVVRPSSASYRSSVPQSLLLTLFAIVYAAC
ncbi:major surface protease gp63, putative [Trypanosoma brucei brucei TREU927]|uniref:Leishmanolysin-like peptidase n=4 Tax=Trypanozoon TaxID=39700 RepID=Q580G0_TRYB2|nr:major surface protease gp63, putative [Trypanosoma brucei brucei TREU927]XP_846997.1 major surface protease gp63, putative [Trypanosoma brucei brucei TREU927]AAX79769.1 major surface protease gp63, putative [Trypanosoma brucei]AAX79798.1 major surface protease gp63, putative [Trypanosoma brucei]AAZ12930.1 major surface protease gp63, putative [Trypanosoma brucei brucei TREU927]AAZ12931.1 major surface protease gp63, putative [Trypanosoma brucei brucei TREU927]